jgi:hypothetical protein
MQKKIKRPDPCYSCGESSKSVFKASKVISSIDPKYKDKYLCSHCRIDIINISYTGDKNA